MALQHTGIASTGTYRYIEFISVHTVHTVYTVHTVHIVHTELKTLEWDILNPDRIINLEIKNERRTSNI